MTGLLLLLTLTCAQAFALDEGGASFSLTAKIADSTQKRAAQTFIQGDQFVLKIEVHNPDSQKIASVRSWLKYDPTKLEAIEIRSADSKFDLSVPDENTIVPADGLVQIGRATTKRYVNTKKPLVAEVTFRVLSAKENDRAEIDWYDFSTNDSSHVSINIMDANGIPKNIASDAPDTLVLIINPVVNKGSATTPKPSAPATKPKTSTGSVVTSVPTKPTVTPIANAAVSKSTLSPQIVSADARGSVIDLTLQVASGSKGTYVYYGRVSGDYLRRISLGAGIKAARINDVTLGETWYITLVSHEGLASEEYRVIAGQGLQLVREVGPLFSSAAGGPDKPKTVPTTGVDVWMLVLLGVVGTSVYAYRRYRVAL